VGYGIPEMMVSAQYDVRLLADFEHLTNIGHGVGRKGGTLKGKKLPGKTPLT
jgi:hypothetical protein